jgi:hypothetical protein
MVGALVKTGVIDELARSATEFTDGNALLTVMLILGVSAPVSGIIDNIPYTATMTPIVSELAASIPDMAHPNALWWALALGADFGGPDGSRRQRQRRDARNRPPRRQSHLVLGIHPQGPVDHGAFDRPVSDLPLAEVLRIRLGRNRTSVVLTILLIAFCIQLTFRTSRSAFRFPILQHV